MVGVILATETARTLGARRSLVGESPFFDSRNGQIVHVDTLGKAVVFVDPRTGQTASLPFNEPPAFAVPLAGEGYILGLSRTGLLHLTDDGRTTRVGTWAPSEGQALNDATVDPLGRLIFGTKVASGHAAGVFVLEGTHCRQLTSGFGLVNGLAVALDSFLFLADTRDAKLWRYPYDVDQATLGARSLCVDFKPRGGRPDGAVADGDGNLWLCELDSGRLVQLSPSGRERLSMKLPVSRPTKPCILPDGQVIVTSMSTGVDLTLEPMAGLTLIAPVAAPPPRPMPVALATTEVQNRR